MKKWNWIITVALVAAFALFALGSGESDTVDQGKSNADKSDAAENAIGDYSVVIDSCRLAKSFDDKAVVIVKYIFSNVSNDEPTAFYIAFEDEVYQDGIGLNEAFVLEDSANYNADNQTKEIKKGASLEVEVAYELNDSTTDIEVEVSELFSFSDTKVTKTFSIAE